MAKVTKNYGKASEQIEDRTYAIDEAIETWHAYLDWAFWDSFNHAVMVELYSQGGRYEDAMDELAWVRGPKDLAYARQTIKDAWQEEMRSLQQPLR